MWLSTEAVIMKQSCGDIYRQIKENPQWGAKLINMVHDQVDLECLSEYAEEVAHMVGVTIKKNLEDYIQTIPVEEANVNYSDWIGQSMGDLH